MTALLKAFNYSGAKTRYLRYYRPLPSDVQRVVEPYLGSGSFVLNAMHHNKVDGIGYEVSPEIVSLWRWLQTCKPQDIYDLDRLVDDTYKRQGRFDVRSLDIPIGALTYLRIHICAIPRGLLRGYLMMPNLKLPVATTVASLPVLRRLDVRHASGHTHVEGDRDAWFIDPPYVDDRRDTTVVDNIRTSGYSRAAEDYSIDDTLQLLERLRRPACVTYGSAAKRVFTKLSWRLVDVRGVGGPNQATRYRAEFVSYINDWN